MYTIRKTMMPLLLGLMILSLSVMIPTVAQESQTCFRATDYIELINLAISKGEYEEALQYVDCIERYYPNSAYTYMFQAFVYESMGDYESMLNSAREAVLKDNYNGFAHLIQARAHFNLEDYPACIQSGESALLFGVREFPTYDMLMRCYHLTAQFELSAEMATKIITIKFNNTVADAYFYRAYAYYQLGRIDEAYADIQEAIHNHDASLGVDFQVQALILLELDEPFLAYASVEQARLLDSSLILDDIYEQIWDVLGIEDITRLNKTFFTEATDLYAQRSRALEALANQDYEMALAQFEGLAGLGYGEYAQQYASATLAYTSLLNGDYTERVLYSNEFSQSANLNRVVRFTELPTEPIIIPTGFWNGGAYRFTVRPNQTYTFTVEAVDGLRVVDPYIVILSGVSQLAVEGVGDDVVVDGRVEYVFNGTPGQYIIFVGGFGLAYGDIRLSYTESR